MLDFYKKLFICQSKSVNAFLYLFLPLPTGGGGYLHNLQKSEKCSIWLLSLVESELLVSIRLSDWQTVIKLP